jgi:beta-lactamase class A
MTPQRLADYAARVYRPLARGAGGTWHALVTVADPPLIAVDDGADTVVQAYSVNKIAVAVAVLDKVERGELALDQRVDVTAEIVEPAGDGIFRLDRAYPSAVTLGHVIAAMLTVSDDIAVRLCGLVCPGPEVNEIMVAKGFPHTQVEPVADDPHRMLLGTTTPRETHDLLQGLVHGTVLGCASTGFLLSLLRSPVAGTDGVRRVMSSAERARVATKAGWYSHRRNEAGVIVDTAGRPVLTYAMFAAGMADPDNFGATHPAAQAHAAMGRAWLDGVDRLDPAAIRHQPDASPSLSGPRPAELGL